MCTWQTTLAQLTKMAEDDSQAFPSTPGRQEGNHALVHRSKPQVPVEPVATSAWERTPSMTIERFSAPLYLMRVMNLFDPALFEYIPRLR